MHYGYACDQSGLRRQGNLFCPTRMEKNPLTQEDRPDVNRGA
jgi:hypothetical protein